MVDTRHDGELLITQHRFIRGLSESTHRYTMINKLSLNLRNNREAYYYYDKLCLSLPSILFPEVLAALVLRQKTK